MTRGPVDLGRAPADQLPGVHPAEPRLAPVTRATDPSIFMALLVMGTGRRLPPGPVMARRGAGPPESGGIYWSGIQLPWKPSGIRAGRWTRATGSAVKSWAARMTRSAAPRSGLWTNAMT